MLIHFLGHSEYIVEIENVLGRHIRILCDTWLTSHAFGDFMERNPRIEIDYNALPELHGIYISHPHCDHLDPYTLVSLYEKQRPPILLPETMLYLRPLFRKYLGDPQIITLRDGQILDWNGISIGALSFSNPYHTNEDDVMMPLFFTQEEIFFSEVDAALPEDPAAQNRLHSIFTRHEFKNRVYMATRNELEALFLSYDAEAAPIRAERIERYMNRREDEIRYEYEKFEMEEPGYPDIWRLDNMIKLFSGQGMIFPTGICPDYLRLSAPFPLSKVCALEKRIAAEYGRGFEIAQHQPGMLSSIEHGHLTGSESLTYLKRMESLPVSFDPNLTIRSNRLPSPLSNREGDAAVLGKRILNILNDRYLPYIITDLEKPLKGLIAKKENGQYVIEVLYGTEENHRSIYYAYGFGDYLFREFEAQPDHPDETYWANDLEDYLDGRQDMFSTTMHRFFPERNIGLWTMLGLPFLNSDLVYRKIEYHFERAANGESPEPWVMAMIAKFKGTFEVRIGDSG